METISGGRNSMVTAVNSINRLITIEVVGLDMAGVSYYLSRSVSFFFFFFFFFFFRLTTFFVAIFSLLLFNVYLPPSISKSISSPSEEIKIGAVTTPVPGADLTT
jgi:hypothetical protein